MPERDHEPIVTDKKNGSIVQTHHVRRAGSRRQALIAVFVVVVIGAVLAGGYFFFLPHDEAFTLSTYDASTVTVETLQDTVELSGTVSARTNATVTSPEDAFVERLYVSEGDWVTKGQVIVQMRAEDLESELVTKQRALEQLRRDYNKFLLQHQYDQQSSERTAKSLADTLSDAQSDLEDTQQLYDIGSATQTDLRTAQKAVESAEDAITDQNAQVEEDNALFELEKQNNEDDITAAEDEVADLQTRIEDTAVTAPITGRVTSIEDAATVSGELISQYETIMEIADTRIPIVETEVEEQYVPLVAVGDSVAVEISGSRLTGTIERIGQIASTSTDGGTPTVELDLTIDTSSEVLPGSSALVTLLVGQVDDALVLPRGPYLTSGNRRYLYVISGDTATRVTVEYGEITDSKVQISSGVKKGDRVITSSYQSFIDNTTIKLGGNE